ncbi:MAG: PHP domain-containing protein, partial [Chitinivibrionales bacterium]
MGDFVHLHNHTEYSFLDGAIKIPDMVKKTIEYGMDTVAITDHGGLFGAVEFIDTCNKMDVKPILGFEAYIAPGSRFNKTKGGAGEKAYSHLLLIAENNTGWKNLMKLSSIGYTQGFYYKPRIDIEVLKEYSEGLIASTACVAGAVPRALSEGNYEKAKGITEEYLSIFGEGNLYLELQDHGIQEEKRAFSGMKELGQEMG